MFVNYDDLKIKEKDGLLLVDKPVGPTSHDIVASVRRKTGIKRVGHAGTLDPFAEGLLIVLVGRDMTKLSDQFLTMDKTYDAVIHLGATSDTEDPTGTIVENENPLIPSKEQIEDALKKLTGEQMQLPSSFSAKKINGKKAYELARAGITPELSPKKVTVHSIELLNYQWPLLTIRTHVSSGTYIRAIARDLGNLLGCGAYVEKLRRTSIGPYTLE